MNLLSPVPVLAESDAMCMVASLADTALIGAGLQQQRNDEAQESTNTPGALQPDSCGG